MLHTLSHPIRALSTLAQAHVDYLSLQSLAFQRNLSLLQQTRLFSTFNRRMID
jgi:hypothetical protein